MDPEAVSDNNGIESVRTTPIITQSNKPMKMTHVRGLCPYTVMIIIFCVVTLIILISCMMSCSDSGDIIVINKSKSNEPKYYTNTVIDDKGIQHSTVTDKMGNVVQEIRKTRDIGLMSDMVETVTYDNGWYTGTRRKSTITYTDNTFQTIASENHVVVDISDGSVLMNVDTVMTGDLTTITTDDMVNSTHTITVVPKNGIVTSDKFDLKDKTKKLSSQSVKQDSLGYVILTEMLFDSNGRVTKAERTKSDSYGNKISHEDITTQMDTLFLSPFAADKMDTQDYQQSGFTGDLPMGSTDVDISGDYASAAMLMSLDSSIYDQQKKYVSDRNRFSNFSGYKSDRDDPNNLIPWMGLRPPSYATNIVSNEARQVPSEMSNDQMTLHKQITWK
jgi:hypothetical protein